MINSLFFGHNYFILRNSYPHISIGNLFDSNCITPGTEFMARLSEHLKFFIAKKIEEDLTWRTIQIIFSGHEVSHSS